MTGAGAGGAPRGGSYVGPGAAGVDAERARLAAQGDVSWSLEREALLALGLRPGGRLVDLGCGSGAYLRRIAAGVGPALAVAVDRDAGLLRGAATAGRAVRADLRALPLRPATFDFALMRFVLRHVTDPAVVVANARDLLAERGRLLVVDADDDVLMLHPEPPGWPRLRGALAETVRRRGGEPAMGRRLRGLLVGAGLADVRTKAITVTSDGVGGPAAFVELYLAPAARPLDPDLMAPPEAREHWAAVGAWALRSDAFAAATGIFCAGVRAS